ncbi:hypothetical protein BC829DRAFT_48348 [Chytridium lagenaria]|nr:hypothetical protein BC829DRAFT_48348 [Chytridium lagenaria]
MNSRNFLNVIFIFSISVVDEALDFNSLNVSLHRPKKHAEAAAAAAASRDAILRAAGITENNAEDEKAIAAATEFVLASLRERFKKSKRKEGEKEEIETYDGPRKKTKVDAATDGAGVEAKEQRSARIANGKSTHRITMPPVPQSIAIPPNSQVTLPPLASLNYRMPAAYPTMFASPVPSNDSMKIHVPPTHTTSSILPSPPDHATVHKDHPQPSPQPLTPQDPTPPPTKPRAKPKRKQKSPVDATPTLIAIHPSRPPKCHNVAAVGMRMSFWRLKRG